GKFDSFYCLKHQRYDYDDLGPNRTVFYQKVDGTCVEICMAMLVADQNSNQSHEDAIKIAREAFPDVEFNDNEKIVEIAGKAIKDVKLKRGKTTIESSLGDALVVLNKLLDSTDKEYVCLRNVKDDELQSFIQASMNHEERGSIVATWSFMAYNHAVII